MTIMMCLLFQLLGTCNDEEAMFLDKLFVFCTGIESIEKYCVRVDDRAATYLDASPEDVKLEIREA